MPVIDRIKDFQNDLVAIRRDIHDEESFQNISIWLRALVSNKP